ncbi:MAG: 1-(5-phosphoribosyl)-5-[(5-phosphoribosylamino)methylideneamino]imidazole-4-carboxamide isomerase [Candidatus Omnitrophica bacterium]|nr:1-(5-phosphoribosyl)-5-[(5-phosphoribosylamino)methylideneamino]imidazole-4-carboxamide isomerase [Candidatus Omnitrophota bacterium]
MLIIPAIDLKDGCVVRFVQGRLDKKVYSRDPVKTAKHWIKQGAKMLHVVDLDGAMSGTIKNLGLVKEIVSNVDVPVQFGGGVRKLETIKALAGFGVWRVVLGTRAVEDKVFLQKAFKLFKNKIIVSIDAKDNNLLIKGWRSSGKAKDVLAFAHTLKKIGFKELIYTDTLKDGTLKGPNIKGVKNLLKETGMKIIASGGMSSLDDIHKLKSLEKQGLTGVIIGKALYEGKFTLTQALKLG